MAVHPPLVIIKTRAEFLRIRGGSKWSGRGFLIEAKPAVASGGPARFGFTVTKKLAPRAVDRNRIRRRLKEAVRMSQGGRSRPAVDYVVVARLPARDMPFVDLLRDFETAFARLGRAPKS